MHGCRHRTRPAHLQIHGRVSGARVYAACPTLATMVVDTLAEDSRMAGLYSGQQPNIFVIRQHRIFTQLHNIFRQPDPKRGDTDPNNTDYAGRSNERDTDVPQSHRCKLFEWLSSTPALLTVPYQPSDWVQQSLPFSYVAVDFSATDNQAHDVQLYSDISAGKCINTSHRCELRGAFDR